MGMLKSSLKLANNIITLGGASRLEDAQKAYQETYGKYTAIYNEANSFQEEIKENIKILGEILTQTKNHLEKSEKIIKRNINDKSGLNTEFATHTLIKVDRFNSEINSALNVGVGSIVGGSLAVGSWALVATLGSASTGTAISTLSGVAATNATLAWFGGGALAAGGAGMAGGMTVLSGIFAIPVIYFAAKNSHKKAKEVEDAKTKLEDMIIKIQEASEMLHLALEDIKLRKNEIDQLCHTLMSDIIKLSKIIRPHGIFSAAKQKFLLIIGKNPYTPQQIAALKRLNLSISVFFSILKMHEHTQPTE